jgi:hypothetical protein
MPLDFTLFNEDAKHMQYLGHKTLKPFIRKELVSTHAEITDFN